MIHRRAVGEAVGTLLLMVLLISTTATLSYALSYMFSALQAAREAAAVAGRPARENLTLVYVQHLPPSGSPGAVMINEGDPVNVTEVLQVEGRGVVATPAGICMPHGGSASIPLNSSEFAVITSSGAAFSHGMGSLPYISVFAYGVSTTPAPGLYYTSGRVVIRASSPASWYVNGSWVENGTQVIVWVDGPTSVTAVAR